MGKKERGVREMEREIKREREREISHVKAVNESAFYHTSLTNLSLYIRLKNIDRFSILKSKR